MTSLAELGRLLSGATIGRDGKIVHIRATTQGDLLKMARRLMDLH